MKAPFKMPNYSSPQTNHIFSINSVLFAMINSLVFFGLVYGIYIDFFILQSHLIVHIANFISFLIFASSLLLVRFGVISRNFNIGVLHILVVANISLVAIIEALNGRAGDVVLMTMIINIALVSSATFLVNHKIALVLGIGTFMLFTWLTVIGGNPYNQTMYPLVAMVMLGQQVVLFYFRVLSNSLSDRLGQSRIALEQTNKDLRLLRQRAELINLQNKPFVIFGKNTAGLVHDFKNDLGLLLATKSLVEMKLERKMEIDPSDLMGLTSGIERLQDRIDKVRYVTSAREDAIPEELPLDKVIQRAIYPFQLTPEVRHAVQFIIQIQQPSPVILGNRYLILQVLENLLKNACEAIIEFNGTGRIEIATWTQSNKAWLTIQDSGPGINGCFDCDIQNCLDCRMFEIGKTTKIDGSGFGMRNVLNGMRELGGDIRLVSSPGQGVKAELSFDLIE